MNEFFEVLTFFCFIIIAWAMIGPDSFVHWVHTLQGIWQ